jgi:uncharacterized protein (TIGR02145 family)
MVAIHDRNIIHKDLKPENIMLTREGAVKIMDFGISETFRSSKSRLEATSRAGTCNYMSPEHCLGENVGRESDVWSFGMLLYELLTGRTYYKGESTNEVHYQIEKRPFEAGTKIGSPLRELLNACGKPNYRDRPKDFTAVLQFFQPHSSRVMEVHPPIIVKAQSKPHPKKEATHENGTVIDIDGNIYRTVKIGNQIWMAENLKVTRYRDGSPIPNVTGNRKWKKLSTGAMCWYDNDNNYNTKYGALYNWYAVNVYQGLAPQGWRVPSDDDWKKLEGYLGSDVEKKLKSKNEWNGLDIAGFGAIPGGFRCASDEIYDGMGSYAYFWSSSEYQSGNAWSRYLGSGNDRGGRRRNGKIDGFSVRCVMD